MKCIHYSLLITLLSLFNSLLLAQPQSRSQSVPELPSGQGVVVGSVVDGNNQPVQYASVYLFNIPDSLTMGMAVTDEEGRFRIGPITFGDYYMEVNFVGYVKHRSQSFKLEEDNPVFRMAQFKLTDKTTQLGAIEVKAQKDMIQTNLDKRVYNVESSINAEGSTAVELLQDIPSVDVDLDGNVTLRGSENVTILVDGRPSNLTLDQIPASQIESIEVITNPSARLEPDGMAGILNVILKKKKESGFNGLINLAGALSLFDKKAYFDNYNGSINLNYSYNKINVFLNYNYRKHGFHSAGDLDRISWFGADSSSLSQVNRQDNSGQGHNVRTGLDWFINKRNTLNFAFGYNHFSRNSESTLNSDNSNIYHGEKIPYMIFDQRGGDKGVSDNFSGNISYLKTFNTKGQEMSADLYYSQMNRDQRQNYVQVYSVPDSADHYYQHTNTLETNRNASAQIDFVTPVGYGGRIETGYKFSLRRVGSDYSLFDGIHEDYLKMDTTQTNNFQYSEYINALYFIYSNTFWEKLKVQAGLRGELSNTVSDLKSSDTVYAPKPQFNLFPTVHVRYDFNTSHSLQLSYSRRVTRPRIHQLNPFIDISDKLNWRTGNPNLTPEFVNSFELGYMMIVKKSTFNITAFYRQRSDIITRYTQIYEAEDALGESYTYTLTSYENLEKSQNFGFEFVYGQRLWKFWRINVNADFYRVIIDSDDLIDENLSRDWAWGFRINQTFTLPKTWDIQLTFRYRSPSLTTGSMGWGTGGVGQGKRSSNYSLGLAVKKGFFDNSFVVTLNIRNLIYSNNTEVHTYSYDTQNGYDAWSNRQNSGFRATLSLTYKINNFKKRVEKYSDSGDEYIEE